jgi:hypothetical protein
MKKQLGYTIIELLITLFLGVVLPAAIVGWVWNIIKLAAMTFDPLTGLLVLRAIGIFVPPVGAVVGYF